MQSKSFAGRLSLKIILMASAIFLLSIAVITIRGSRITHSESLDYSVQSLLNSSSGIEATMLSVEHIANSFGRTVEAYNHNGYQLDTNRFFPLLEELLKNNKYILGCGVYYEPYAFNSKSKIAGVYVSKNYQSGEIEVEWDDDESFLKDGWSYFESDWYAGAVKSGEPLWIKPFIDYMITGDYRYMTTYSVPLRDKNSKIFGVCTFDMSLDWLYDKLVSLRPYPGSNVCIVDHEGDFVCNPHREKPYEGNVFDTWWLEGLSRGNVMESLDWNDRGEAKLLDEPRYGHFFLAKEMYNGWILVLVNRYREAYAQIIVIWLIMFIITLLGLVLLFFASRNIIHKEARPLVYFAEAASKITGGHFNVPIPAVKHDDEISKLGDALRYMQKSISDYIVELTVTTVEKERLAGELNVARDIQMQMLDTDFPRIGDGGFYASSVPARQVGGDLYDFFVSDNLLYFMLGDVSGKGTPAALLMAISISAFRAAIRNLHTMSEITNVVNKVFCRCNNDFMFVTAVIGCINIDTGEVEVCNAGHNPMVLITPGGEASFMKLKNNLACGVLEDFDYQSENFVLAKGSRLIVYSDGVTEAEDSSQNQYGEDRLLEFARSHNKAAVKDDSRVINELAESVNLFVGGAEQFDDITMMSISL